MTENVQPRADRLNIGYMERKSDDKIRKRISGDRQIEWGQLDTTDGEVNEADTDTTKNKLVSNALAKGWQDHVDVTDGNPHGTDHSALDNILEADPASADTSRNKHVSNADMKAAADHRALTSAHGASGNLIGTGNAASEATRGAVYQSDLVNAAAALTASNVTGSPGTGDGALATISGSGDDANINNNFQDIADEYNALFADVTEVRTQLNDLISKLKTAGVVNTS